MSIPDLITQFCRTPQVISGDEVSEHQIEFPSDAERYVFIHSDNLIRITVAVIPGTMVAGMRAEFRFADDATLNSNYIVAGVSRILLPAALTLRSQHYFRINPMAIPDGFDFAGLFFVMEDDSPTGGFAVYADLVDGAEKFDAVDSAV